MAPVPEAASRDTSPSVPWSFRSESVTRFITARKTSVRWGGGSWARALNTRAGISTGPGGNNGVRRTFTGVVAIRGGRIHQLASVRVGGQPGVAGEVGQ